MQFRSLPLLAGLIIASMACFGRPAFADAYYLERWSAGASVRGVPFTGGFVYDATTGGVIGGNNTSIPGFCASGGCAFNINTPSEVVVSNAAGASVQLIFNDATFGTIGPHLLKFAINGPLPDIFGFQYFPLSVTGGLNVSAVPLLLEQWTAGASIGGVPITGSFFYDPATGGIVGNNTSIPGFCASGGCAFNILARSDVVVSNAAGASVQLIFNDATFGTIGPHLLNIVMNGPQPDIFGGPDRPLSATGGLNVSAAPAPAPGVGLASLFALAAAIFGSRRLRDGLPPRG
jgi:hypothetical protein